MTARDEILGDYRDLRSETCVSAECRAECEQDAMLRLDAYRAEVLREAADTILIDLDQQNPGTGEYRNGMRRADFLLRRMAEGESND